MDGLPFLEYVQAFQDELLTNAQVHLLLTVQVLLLASVLGVLLAIATYRSSTLAGLGIATVSVAFTIPSLALFGLMVPQFGRGLATAFPVLVLYALLPIVRNSVVGLRSVDANMIDAARGMGMSRLRILWQIELPMAWPVILTGIRVSGQLTIGIAVIAAFVSGPGLGEGIFNALANLGSVNTFNEALAGTLLVAIIALVLDASFILIRRLTTPRGLRV